MTPIIFWSSVRLRDRSRLPAKPGLYAVRSMGKTFYIGRSVNLQDRWQGDSHHRFYMARLLPGVRLRYCVLSRAEIDSQEEDLIVKVKPPWNYTSVPHHSYAGAVWWFMRRIPVWIWWWLGLVGSAVFFIEVLGLG